MSQTACVTVEYAESELTGMAGAVTRLSFDRENPSLLTMMREGTVETVLIFEQGRQHICAYRTPYMPFELCIRSYRVVNELLKSGFIYLDYTVEVRGARLERNKFTLEMTAADQRLEELLAHDICPRSALERRTTHECAADDSYRRRIPAHTEQKTGVGLSPVRR